MIARKFNNKFGETFVEPETIISPAPRIMSLVNPDKKMSKSLGESNYIALLDSPEIIKQKVMGAVTDIGPKKDGMSRGVANLFSLLELFAEKKDVVGFKQDYQHGTLKYQKLKEFLAEKIIESLKPIQERYNDLIKNKTKINDVLEKGAAQAQKIAAKNIKEIKEKMGLL